MRLFGTLLLLTCSVQCFSQADFIIRLPEQDRIKVLWMEHYYAHKSQEYIGDSARVMALYDKMESQFKKGGFQDLAQQVWLMRKLYRITFLYLDDPKSAASMERAREEAQQMGWNVVAAECVLYTGFVHFNQQDYGPGIDGMVKGYKQLKELGFEKHPHTMRHIVNLAYAYYFLEDYTTALGYLKESLLIPPPWNENGFHRQTLNTLGLCFQRQMQYDSAIHYFQLAHEESVIARDSFWAGLSNGNKGQAYVLSGRYDDAVPLLKADYQQSIISEEFGSALSAALELAAIYTKRGKLDTAEQYQAFVAIHLNPKDFKSMSRFYRNRYEIDKGRGDFRKASINADSFHLFRDSMVYYNDTHIKNRITRQAAINEYTHEIRMLEGARNRQVLLRNALLVILVLSGGLVALWINRQRLKRRKEVEVQRMQQQVAEEELRRAQVELNAFTETLRQKNTIIDSFQSEIETLRSTSLSSAQERSEQVGALLNATILTEDDWKEFRRMFDKVHPGFFGFLKEKYPDLTPADLRLLSLTKLKLAPREMMSMLGVSYDAIKKSRKRLLTRLDLPEEENLAAFVESIA